MIGTINFMDPANTKQAYGILVNAVRNEAPYISNKYKILIDPMQYEWDKFLSTLEKDFLDILNEVLSCKNSLQHQLSSNVNNSMPHKNRSQYNTVIENRTRTLTNQFPLAVNTNGAYGYEHILHSTPENNTKVENIHNSLKGPS